MPRILRIKDVNPQNGDVSIIFREKWKASNYPENEMPFFVTLEDYEMRKGTLHPRCTRVCIACIGKDSPIEMAGIQRWAKKMGILDLHAHFYVNSRGDVYEGLPIGAEAVWFSESLLNKKTIFIAVIGNKIGDDLLSQWEATDSWGKNIAITNILRLIRMIKARLFDIRKLESNNEIKNADTLSADVSCPYPKLFAYITKELGFKATQKASDKKSDLYDETGGAYLQGKNAFIQYDEWKNDNNYKNEMAALTILAQCKQMQDNFFSYAEKLKVEVVFSCRVDTRELLRWNANGITKMLIVPSLLVTGGNEEGAIEYLVKYHQEGLKKVLHKDTQFKITVGIYSDKMDASSPERKIGLQLQTLTHECLLHGYAYLKYVEYVRNSKVTKENVNSSTLVADFSNWYNEGFLNGDFQENVLSTTHLQPYQIDKNQSVTDSLFHSVSESILDYLSKKSTIAKKGFEERQNTDNAKHLDARKKLTKTYSNNLQVLQTK